MQKYKALREQARDATVSAEAVLDAYSWPHDLSEDEILARLLELNLARSRIGESGNDKK